MLRRKKEKFDKPYCGQCKYHGRLDYCEVHPEKLSQEWLASGESTLHPAMCAVKNDKNLCTDFKRK